jgi:hypothetical protein
MSRHVDTQTLQAALADTQNTALQKHISITPPFKSFDFDEDA